MTSAPQDTCERLLDAAEALFAERGFEGASLREITSRARTNLAAANYHFRSKEALLDAVLERRVGPMNQERLQRLEAAEARAGERGPELEEILEILVGPPLRRTRDAAGGAFLRIVGRLHAGSGAHWERFHANFRPIKERFTHALERASPGLSREELFWRVHFAIGAMVGVMMDCQRLSEISNGLCDPKDADAAIDQLVPFLAAGMRAPSIDARRERRGRAGTRASRKARP